MPALLIAGGAVGGALISANATNKATKASTNATNQSLELQRQQYEQTQQNLAPYQQAGQDGLNALTGRVSDPNGGTYGSTANPTDPGNFSYTAADYHSSPGYQWQLDQGINAIQSSQAARGALGSGATLKALQTYGQGLANQDFNQERNAAQGIYNTNLNKYQNDRNYLTNRYDQGTQTAGSLATLGANAAAGVGTAGASFANNSSNLLTSNAANVGNAALANAGNTNSLINQGLNLYMNRSGLVNGLASGTTPLYGTANNIASVPASSMFFG